VLAVVNNGTHFLAEMRHALDVIGVDYELLSGGSRVSPSTLRAYAGIILSGGDVHVYEPEELATVRVDPQVIELATVPVLGICLGHQLIAHHFGAPIQPLLRPVDREELMEIVRPDALFSGLSERFLARVAHDDAVVGLAGPLVRLARSPIGDYEAIRHRDQLVYGLQFHPEASGAAGLTLLQNFVGLCQRGAATTPVGPRLRGHA
jgi:GMP synthase-like glutamine amidotransferase